MRMRKRYQRLATGGAVHPEPLVASIDVQRDSGDENDSASDDPSIAFQQQIDALRRAEALTAKSVYGAGSQVHDPQQPQLTPRQQAFIDANPEMMDEPERLGKAILQAHTQGFEPDSDAFHEAVGHNWRAHHVTIGAENMADRHRAIGSDDDSSRRMGRLVSAPVSRDTMGTGGGSYGDNRPGRVTLSIAQKEAAKIAGISEKEYAENVLRLRAEKAEGNYGGSP